MSPKAHTAPQPYLISKVLGLSLVLLLWLFYGVIVNFDRSQIKL